MPIFQISNKRLIPVEQTNFITEKDLQSLIEANLAPVFNCRFVSSEFSTGAQHAGRIDTLALSEDNNPVIIEYKKVESSSYGATVFSRTLVCFSKRSFTGRYLPLRILRPVIRIQLWSLPERKRLWLGPPASIVLSSTFQGSLNP